MFHVERSSPRGSRSPVDSRGPLGRSAMTPARTREGSTWNTPNHHRTTRTVRWHPRANRRTRDGQHRQRGPPHEHMALTRTRRRPDHRVVPSRRRTCTPRSRPAQRRTVDRRGRHPRARRRTVASPRGPSPCRYSRILGCVNQASGTYDDHHGAEAPVPDPLGGSTTLHHGRAGTQALYFLSFSRDPQELA
jgi:hypothetical protein